MPNKIEEFKTKDIEANKYYDENYTDSEPEYDSESRSEDKIISANNRPLFSKITSGYHADIDETPESQRSQQSKEVNPQYKLDMQYYERNSESQEEGKRGYATRIGRKDKPEKFTYRLTDERNHKMK
ncbi:hypothetical protein N9W34_02885 [Rickettsiales bacterium]|nr:hypothetical protein [Rickettsiales bacterium]